MNKEIRLKYKEQIGDCQRREGWGAGMTKSLKGIKRYKFAVIKKGGKKAIFLPE